MTVQPQRVAGVPGAGGIVFSPPSPVLQSGPQGPPLARAYRARSNSPRVLWTAETAQRARLVAKAQADVCIAVARAASAEKLAPENPVGPKIIRQSSFSPRHPQVLHRAVSAPPQGLQMAPGTPYGTPKVGYRQVARVVSPRPQQATPRSPGLPTGRPPNPRNPMAPTPAAPAAINPANPPLKRASSAPRNAFGMESPGRKAQTPSPSPMQRYRDT